MTTNQWDRKADHQMWDLKTDIQSVHRKANYQTVGHADNQTLGQEGGEKG
jgi:hypothetical protein